MDLFVVNRFLGDSTQESNQNFEEGIPIKNLLSKIQERKKRKLHEDEASVNNTVTSVKDGDVKEARSSSKKKKKKPKLLTETQDFHFQVTEIDSDEKVKNDSLGELKVLSEAEGSNEVFRSPKKKKKREKSCNKSTDALEVANNDVFDVIKASDSNGSLGEAEVLSEPIIEDVNEVFRSPKKKRKREKSSRKSTDVLEGAPNDVSNIINGGDSYADLGVNQDAPNSDPMIEEASNKDVHSSFTVIGTELNQGKLKANRKLPSWLENPVVIPVDLDKKENIEQCFPLDQRLIQKLKDNKITHFFPVQEKVIPWLLKNNLRCLYHWPRDICVSAPTGSGKTLAFVLPIVQALIGRVIPAIRALVVLPVAELAKQVGAVFHQYCSGFGLKVTVAIGGTSFLKEHNLLSTTNELVGCQTDIMVTTPGRLVAHLRAHSRNSAVGSSGSFSSGSISLTHLQFLVIDEADRVIEGSQNDWLSHLMHHLELQAGIDSTLLPPSVSVLRKFNRHPHRPPQKLLFSATLSQDPEKLCTLNLFQPKLFSTVPHKREGASGDKEEENAVAKYVTPKELSEEHVIVQGGEHEKPLVLLWLLHQQIQGGNVHKALIFSSSRQSAARLALLLSLMLSNDSPILLTHLSADLQIQDRQKIMTDFARGSTNVLVSSDALARGVDIPQVDLVISYDPPRHLKNHIHRIGRTGRAGRRGFAVTILTPNQQGAFSSMICGDASMGHSSEISLSPDSLVSFQDKYKEALAKMQDTLKEEQQKMVSASKKRKRRGRMIVKK